MVYSLFSKWFIVSSAILLLLSAFNPPELYPLLEVPSSDIISHIRHARQPIFFSPNPMKLSHTFQSYFLHSPSPSSVQSMSFSFLAILLLLVAFLLVEARPTIDNLGVLLRERRYPLSCFCCETKRISAQIQLFWPDWSRSWATILPAMDVYSTCSGLDDRI